MVIITFVSIMNKILYHIFFIVFVLSSHPLIAQDGGHKDDKEVEVPKMRQAKGVSRSKDNDALYSSAKTRKKNEKKVQRRTISKNDRQRKRDYKKLRKKQQNFRTTRRMKRHERKSNKINKENNVPFFKRLFGKKSTEKKHRKKDHNMKRKKKQKKIKSSRGFSRNN